MENIEPLVEERKGLTHRLLRGPHAEWMLGWISFLESMLLPIVIDPFLVILILARPERWLRYSVIASSFSVLGGIAGYILGAVFFDLIGARIIALYNLEASFAHAVELFDGNVFWVMLIAAFTPIPFKLFAIVGGFLKVNFVLFVLASIVGRFARFLLVGYIAERFGKTALVIFSRHMNLITFAAVASVLVYAALTLLP